MNRPVLEDYIRQIEKDQFLTFDTSEQPMGITSPNIIWKKILHKEQITFAEIVRLKRKYLLTASMDGYLKMTEVKKSEVVGSMDISLPLPIKWEVEL